MSHFLTKSETRYLLFSVFHLPARGCAGNPVPSHRLFILTIEGKATVQNGTYKSCPFSISTYCVHTTCSHIMSFCKLFPFPY